MLNIECLFYLMKLYFLPSINCYIQRLQYKEENPNVILCSKMERCENPLGISLFLQLKALLLKHFEFVIFWIIIQNYNCNKIWSLWVRESAIIKEFSPYLSAEMQVIPLPINVFIGCMFLLVSSTFRTKGKSIRRVNKEK